jgi:hypothetical protein
MEKGGKVKKDFSVQTESCKKVYWGKKTEDYVRRMER